MPLPDIHVVLPDALAREKTSWMRPPCPEAIPMRIAVTPGIEIAARTPEDALPRLAYSAATVAPLGALAKIAANSSLFRLAPPTSAPPTSGRARIARALEGLAEPP